MTAQHRQRQSYEGFDRKRLRGTLTVSLGVKANAQMFEGRGQSWHVTRAQERKEAQERALLEKHLREASLSETQFISHLQERLNHEPGPLPPVKVNKKQLALEKKPKVPCRKSREGKFVRLALKVNQLAKLHKERQANEKVAAVTTDKHRDFGHFIIERD